MQDIEIQNQTSEQDTDTNNIETIIVSNLSQKNGVNCLIKLQRMDCHKQRVTGVTTLITNPGFYRIIFVYNRNNCSTTYTIWNQSDNFKIIIILNKNILPVIVDPRMNPVKEEHLNASIKQKNSTPSFLIKTYEILANSDYEHIIQWIPEGNAFVVKNISELAEKVLPNHFKHNNYASFVRQLNMYDFHKIKNESGENEFRHKFFQQGNKNLLSEIKRKQGDQNEQNDDRQLLTDQSSFLCHDINKLKVDYQFFLNEMMEIKSKQQELHNAFAIINTQNDHLNNENKLLWQEILRIRETDERKIQTLSYLLTQLMSQQPVNTQPIPTTKNIATVPEREKQNVSFMEQAQNKKVCPNPSQQQLPQQDQLILNQLMSGQCSNNNILQSLLNSQQQTHLSLSQQQSQMFAGSNHLNSLAGFYPQQNNQAELECQFDQNINASLVKQLELMHQLQPQAQQHQINLFQQQQQGQQNLPMYNLQQLHMLCQRQLPDKHYQ